VLFPDVEVSSQNHVRQWVELYMYISGSQKCIFFIYYGGNLCTVNWHCKWNL